MPDDLYEMRLRAVQGLDAANAYIAELERRLASRPAPSNTTEAGEDQIAALNEAHR